MKQLLLVAALLAAPAVRAEADATAGALQPVLGPEAARWPAAGIGATAARPGLAQAEVVGGYRRNPFATMALDAGYGGVAGMIVGAGVALVDRWHHQGRDLMVGAGAGVLAGAAFGAAEAAFAASDSVARDGLDRTDKDPVVAHRPAFAMALRF